VLRTVDEHVAEQYYRRASRHRERIRGAHFGDRQQFTMTDDTPYGILRDGSPQLITMWMCPDGKPCPLFFDGLRQLTHKPSHLRMVLCSAGKIVLAPNQATNDGANAG